MPFSVYVQDPTFNCDRCGRDRRRASRKVCPLCKKAFGDCCYAIHEDREHRHERAIGKSTRPCKPIARRGSHVR